MLLYLGKMANFLQACIVTLMSCASFTDYWKCNQEKLLNRYSIHCTNWITRDFKHGYQKHMNKAGHQIWSYDIGIDSCTLLTPGPVFCLLLGVSSDYAQPITGQVTGVTCPVIGRAQPELTPGKRQKTGPGQFQYICREWVERYYVSTLLRDPHNKDTHIARTYRLYKFSLALNVIWMLSELLYP